MPRIVYPDADTEFATLLAGPFADRMSALGNHEVHLGQPETDIAWLQRIGDAEAIILGWGLPDAVIERAPNLRMISFTGIGVANFVNLALCTSRDITVSNTPGYADQTVAEHTLALMFACARHIVSLDRAVRSGHWRGDQQGFDLRGKTLGLIGFGGIGRRTADLATALGMHVVAWARDRAVVDASPSAVFADMPELLRESDIVSLHLALNTETIGFLDADRIGTMKEGAVLINTARGELIDETAMIEALQDGRLSSAGVDVFAEEPLPDDHPFRSIENVVLTPHTGFNTPEAGVAILELAIANLEAWNRGVPINVVIP